MRIYKKGKESHLFNNLAGQKFGNLIVIKYVWHTPKKGSSQFRWKCQCDCGEVSYIRSSNLSDGSRIDCKKCSKKRQAAKQVLPEKLSVLHRIFRTYKRSAKDKKLSFNLTLEEFDDILQKNCEYCGETPKEYNDGYRRNGIDRIDSSIGYHQSNIVPCCEMCNRAKLDYTQSSFFEWVKKIYQNLKQSKKL